MSYWSLLKLQQTASTKVTKSVSNKFPVKLVKSSSFLPLKVVAFNQNTSCAPDIKAATQNI